MKARIWMTGLREAQAATRAEMAQRCKCSEYLLEMLEAGEWITTPKMAKVIVKAYGMTRDQEKQITYVKPKKRQEGYDRQKYKPEGRARRARA